MEQIDRSEEWRVIPGHPLYEASMLGQIRRSESERVLKPWWSKRKGKRRYLYVALSEDGVVTNHSVHDLVAATFIGPKPQGYTVEHQDLDRGNNTPANLTYLPNADNIRAGFAAGAYPAGDARWNAKLTEEKVRYAKVRLAAGDTLRAIADTLGVCPQNIHQIKQGKSWAWVQ